MKTLIWIVVATIIYILSVMLMKRQIRKEHKPGGRWASISPSELDVFFTLFPILNTITGIFLMLINFPPCINPKKFFKL